MPGAQHSYSKKRRALLYLHVLQSRCVGVMPRIPCSLTKGSAARKAGCAAYKQDTRENVESAALSFLRVAACEGRRGAPLCVCSLLLGGWCLVCSALPCRCSLCLSCAACRCVAVNSISGLTRKLRGQVAGVTFVLGDAAPRRHRCLVSSALCCCWWASPWTPTGAHNASVAYASVGGCC